MVGGEGWIRSLGLADANYCIQNGKRNPLAVQGLGLGAFTAVFWVQATWQGWKKNPKPLNLLSYSSG